MSHRSLIFNHFVATFLILFFLKSTGPIYLITVYLITNLFLTREILYKKTVNLGTHLLIAIIIIGSLPPMLKNDANIANLNINDAGIAGLVLIYLTGAFIVDFILKKRKKNHG